MADISWDENALAVWITSIEETLIPDLAEQVAETAVALAPVRTRSTGIPAWVKHGHIGAPGRLKASVGWGMGVDYLGTYADVGALWYGRFMDPKARQLHYERPFLPSALYFIVQGRVYYL